MEKMGKKEAREIIDKDMKCFKIEGTSYCNMHPGCAGCDLRVTESELTEAKRVLCIKEIRKYSL